jgi:hypothetical protein
MIFRESAEQQALFQWVEYNTVKYPQLKLLFAIPNGGKRDKREAARLKREGTRAGVPDVCLPIPKGNYCGLWVEMKSGKGKLSDNQKKWKEQLESWGHKVAVCYGWEEAKECILEYLKSN